MSNHLIQPISIAGNLYCPDYHGKRATRGVATAIVMAADEAPNLTNVASPWSVTLPSYNNYSEISFGVACGETVSITYAASSPDLENNDILCDIYINGVFESNFLVLGGVNPDTASINHSLITGECGVVVTLISYRYENSGLDTISLSITINSIT